MKVTKYPQSCLIIENDGKKLMIDPGQHIAAEFQPDEFSVDGVLITHEHSDHADPEFLKTLLSSNNVPVVGNRSTKNLLGDIVTQVVEDAEEFELAGFTITARELPHMPMTDGSAGPQNTGYVINGVFFHPGDGKSIENLKVDTLAAPLNGPDISAREVFDFIKQVGCSKVVPIHYDAFPADPSFFAQLAASTTPNVKFIVLDNGQATDL